MGTIEDRRETNRERGETIHTVNKGKTAFRLVVLRWKKEQPELFDDENYCYHAIATNLECKAEDVVWQYNSIADAENMIKELKIGFGMEEMPRGLCERILV